MRFRKFIPVVKLEEQDDDSLIVHGLVTGEQPDLDDEICDYESTKPYYKAKTEHFMKATLRVEGMETSIMPMREMHQLSAIGSGRGIEFDDTAKTICMTFKVVDKPAITKFRSGVYIGFSQGGDYIKTWLDPDKPKYQRYTADPGEVSAVDSPCLPSALVDHMKARQFVLVTKNGSTSLHKFKLQAPATTGDFITQAKAWAKKQGISYTKACERVGRALTYLTAPKLEKGMYSVAQFAEILETLSWLQQSSVYEREFEGDGSKEPEDLAALVDHACTCFTAMVAEESAELVAQAQALSSKAGVQGAKAMKFKVLKAADVKKMNLEDFQKAFFELQTEAEEMDKAAKGILAHLTTMHKAASDHCANMVKASGDHMADMHGAIAKCMKAAGAEAPGDADDKKGKDGKDGKEQDDAEKAAIALLEKKGLHVVAKPGAQGLTDEQVNKMVEEGIKKALSEQTTSRVRGTLIGRDGKEVEKAAAPVVAGDTTDLTNDGI
jgi:hypothetical protein